MSCKHIEIILPNDLSRQVYEAKLKLDELLAAIDAYREVYTDSAAIDEDVRFAERKVHHWMQICENIKFFQ